MRHEPFLLLDDWDRGEGATKLFRSPVRIYAPHTAAEAERDLDALDAELRSGRHVAGAFAYELGFLFEPRLRGRCRPRTGEPLFWAGVFASPELLTAGETEAFLRAESASLADDAFAPPAPALSRTDYMARVERVLDLIRAGDIYQANLTFPLELALDGDPLALYRLLRRAQPVSLGGFVRTGELDLLSLSPELFLERRAGRILTKPMKGTAPRGATPAEDRALAEALASDPKSRAENLMIVDLMRNDVGRIAEIGSVRAHPLFEVESLPRLHQMTSTVEGRLEGPPATELRALFRALFPCGSITGAPKLRAMEVIEALETGPRGFYTGAIGALEPGGRARFNVAIRTAVFEPNGIGRMGIGSGIVADSDPSAEYDECLLKGAFLQEAARPFHLIETMRWDRGEGIARRAYHLDRLMRGARAFALPIARAEADEALDRVQAEAEKGDRPALKLRLTAARDGTVSVEASPLPGAPEGAWTFAFADERLLSGDRFRRHKTSERHLYERVLARMAAATGCDEVLFLNERGECAEGARTNLFVRLGGRLVTPPVASGALPGTLRAQLLDDAGSGVEEGVVFPEDVLAADAVYFGNSVRGLVEARLVHPQSEDRKVAT